MIRRLSLIASLVSLVCLAPAARGQAPSDDARQEALTAQYQTAQAHYLAKRFTEALPLFETVARELDSPNAQLYVGRSLQALGRPLEAHQALERCVAMAARQGDKYADTAAVATKEASAIAAELGRVVVRFEDPPEGLRVEVAGRTVDRDALDAPLLVAPGETRIDALAPGRPLLRQVITVEAGSLQTVVLRFAPEIAPAPAPIAPPVAPAPTPAPAPAGDVSEQGGDVRIAGYVVAGIGVGGFVTLAVAGSLANARFEEIDGECAGRCDASYDDRIDGGRTLDLVANVGLGVGIAGTIAGVLMIALGGPTEATSPVSIDRDGVGYRFRF